MTTETKTPEPKIVNIPVSIPDSLVKMGFIEMYASKLAGWKPTVVRTIYNDDGTSQPEAMPNPETAEQACIRFNLNRIKEESKNIFLQLEAEQAKEKALETFNSIFN
jgi:hypothetical protein